MNLSKLTQKMLKFSLVVTAAAVAFTACGPKAVDFSILPAGQATFQGSVANNKVDILWVIDNSGSMATKQQNLANGFDSFANVFVTKGFDFNMAIVTTDTYATTHAPIAGQEGIFQGAPTVITSSTANFSNIFKANVQVGDTGNADAKALDAILLSLSSGLLAGPNAGFLRSDAHLAVIVLSDADDNDSTATTTNVTNFLSTLKPDRFDVLSRTYKKNYTISAVVVDTSNPSNAACPLPFEDGVKFKALANATNGSIASICEADFSSGLNSISQRIAEAITEIPLARTPNVSTLSVTFNGVPVTQDSTNGWSYSSSGNKIVFHGSAIPNANTSISINYIPSDIIR